MKKNSDLIKIGRLVSAQGIKGYVNLESYASTAKNILNYQLFDFRQEIFPNIEFVNGPKGKNKNIFVVKVEGVDNRNQARNLCGLELYIKRSQLPVLEDDEFYYSDLIKLEVIDSKNNKIGRVTKVDDFGAGGIIQIDLYKKDKSGNKNYILPFRNFIFPEINLKENYIKLVLPEFVELSEN